VRHLRLSVITVYSGSASSRVKCDSVSTMSVNTDVIWQTMGLPSSNDPIGSVSAGNGNDKNNNFWCR
jgi:hypothetical protein